jgi:Cytochrome P450
MVSAGLDTVPGNLIMGIAYLSSPHGQEIQKRAYQEIMKVYPDGDAWEKCLTEEKVSYVTALVREVLRFYTVIPICLPRTSIKDIHYGGAVIPAGTTFFMVSFHFASDVRHNNTNHSRDRTHGQPTTTPRTLKTLSLLTQTDTSTFKKAQGRCIMHMEQGPGCAQAPILRIGSCIRRLYGSLALSISIRLGIQRICRFWMHWSVIRCQQV